VSGCGKTVKASLMEGQRFGYGTNFLNVQKGGL